MITVEDTPEQAAYRAEIRRWAERHITGDMRFSRDHARLLDLDRLLARHGLLAASWPAEYGGAGLPLVLQTILTQELERAGVQRAKSPSHQGVNNIGPTLITHGTEDQKRRLLPAILSVTELWCQGFSETEAGSDLASVRTTARRAGDEYVVSGAKIWTSGAEHASWIYLLVRTGTPSQRHRGLSFLVTPTDVAGLTTRPIEQVVGESEFSEVLLDEVRIPVGNRVGAEGSGWSVAMALLSSERLSGRHRYGLLRHELVALAGEYQRDGRLGDAAARDLGRLVAEVEGMKALADRIESLAAAGSDAGVLPSVNKLWWPAVHQRLAEAGLGATTSGRGDPSPWYDQWLATRPESIYGGAAEIQRNIISERFLKLPR
ncbi:acyl-CoA dehydrogenase family protein [Dactylosporangium sp. CA-092794]|uniref:acyl-CoA dehydrogenase family protein n=1 Tax=Dactylosporangium sp. CA-092794 TaxID=3239929 RepID=UPI003D92E9EA